MLLSVSLYDSSKCKYCQELQGVKDVKMTSHLVQQVVGRVHLGMEIVDKLNNTEIDFKDKPVTPITISSCGLTDAQGTHETVEETAAALAKQTETPEQAASRLQADAAAVKDALQ